MIAVTITRRLTTAVATIALIASAGVSAAHAQGNMPEDLFVFDDQLHMIRESMDGPLALRALSQGTGEAAKAAGFDKPTGEVADG